MARSSSESSPLRLLDRRADALATPARGERRQSLSDDASHDHGVVSADAITLPSASHHRPGLGELLAQAGAGHPDALAALYDETGPRVYGLVLAILRSPARAEKVTQEVYLEVWRQAARYPGRPGAELTWMIGIAHRLAVREVRSQRLAEAAPPAVAATLSWNELPALLGQPATARPVASRPALSSQQQEILTLTYWCGYSRRQVAERLTLPLTAVSHTISEGLAQLRASAGVTSEWGAGRA
ncbi:MAG: sigma-70 family polymerase sigma factor [Friedmanniella sp.]|nr:sigma-70 family polymerase sigma factor [Friedmanniella sp.]